MELNRILASGGVFEDVVQSGTGLSLALIAFSNTRSCMALSLI